MVEFKNVKKSFGKVNVLRGLDLSIPKGKIVAILGPNGSGKTTMIKSVLGMVIPDEGEILVDNCIIGKDAAYRRKINYLPQIARFPENLTVKELIAMIRDVRNEDSFEEPLIEKFELQEHLSKRLSNLSGGTRQKVNIVLAFMFDGELVVLDEPTAGLDPVSLIKLKEIIDLKRREGKTLLITTHIMSLVEELADELVFLLEGKIHFQGSIDDLKLMSSQTNLEKAIAHLLTDGND